MSRLSLLLAALLMGWTHVLSGQATLDCLPANGTPGTFVYDMAEVLSPAEETRLNGALRLLADSTSNSIVVVTHPDFCGESPFDFATGVGRKWGVGNAEFDNGVVVALSPKARGRKGQVFIAVGSGLEGAIPDVTANRIIQGELIPAFKRGGAGAYAQGLSNAIAVLGPLSSGEIDTYERKRKGSSRDMVGTILLCLCFGLCIVLIVASQVSHYAKTNTLDFWVAFWILMNSTGNQGSYGEFSHGRGRFGGGRGGFSGGSSGFSGFGGGGFGGGGAGGSW